MSPLIQGFDELCTHLSTKQQQEGGLEFVSFPLIHSNK